jgi:hypothetical protein
MRLNSLFLILALCGAVQLGCEEPDRTGGEGEGEGEGHGEGEGEGHGEGEGEGEGAGLGSLTVISEPETGANITLNGVATGNITNHTFDELRTGRHLVQLSLPGFVIDHESCTNEELPCIPEINVNAEHTEVQIKTCVDLTGRWRNENTGLYVDVTMHRISPEKIDMCPDSKITARGFNPLGSICVETDRSLSRCKYQAEECQHNYAEGQILEDGRRVEITFDDFGGVKTTIRFSKVN